MISIRLSSAIAGAVLLFGMSTAHATPVINGVATHTLTLQNIVQDAMGLAYNPTFDQYYGARGGSPQFTGQVWDSSGTRIQNFAPVNVDYRGVWYNPNTGNVEVQSYNPAGSLASHGVFSVGLDSNGLYTGTNTKLTSVSGFAFPQSVGDYDASRDRIYSRSNSNIVSIADHATGNSLGTITLDLGAVSGPFTLQNYTIGYAEDVDSLVTFDTTGHRALIFAMDGSYIGESALPGLAAPALLYSMAYENGQLFVADLSNNTWVGYKLFLGTSATSAVPAPGTLVLFGLGVAGLHARRRGMI